MFGGRKIMFFVVSRFYVLGEERESFFGVGGERGVCGFEILEGVLNVGVFLWYGFEVGLGGYFFCEGFLVVKRLYFLDER